MSRRAVVIGGSVAGMLAAAALFRSMDEVIVLERDELPDRPSPRKRIPQARHAHVLLPSGRDAIQELLPVANVHRRLLAAGAREQPMTDMLGFGPQGWQRRWPTVTDDLLLTCCSRDLLDWTLRDAVLSTTPVVVRRAEALSLVGTAERVTGVRVLSEGLEEELRADLVVDASGRGSRVEHWLEGLGVTDIPTDEVDSGLVCASRVFRVPWGAEDFPLTQVEADPTDSRPGRSGTLVPIEDGRWLVTLAGTRGGEPTADPEYFTDFALRLRHPLIGQLVSVAEPLGEVFLSRSTRNRRRDFEKAVMPEGLVVLGDAVATFNPVYAQGMSVAALGAQALSRQLRQTDVTAPGFARDVQRAAAKSVSAAYTMSTSQDQWFPEVVGRAPSLADRLLSQYMGRMARVATTSYSVSAAKCKVATLQADTSSLLHTELLVATLKGPVMEPLTGPPLTSEESAFLNSVGPLAV
ncbi:FAD-dependent oxidoreductase [Streptomyces sp. NBC_00151]|uniref:FAD-dependent oxidoreductase n=1 Tax=Streptomyces sp. NBC_00151 TaxID=2975669 RepID=UPI002DD8FEE3|nr:FAD-dependent monooxygenase [Streptomyces sp. NBC_00151]WRZ43396.1 FAD-dependent monooxygenase [Streptomyces sp. NBC_00151]